tara:strand:+ start:743 stop:1060 length:318 start_codon:yes stop_codon:yes gene_type:complete
MIREAVIMVRVWERTIPHEVVDFPSPWDAETPRSLRERALFAGLIDRAVRSAMRRLDARPDSAVSEHNHFLAGLRRHDASAYETRMLREEIAALKGSLIASGHLA